jgi:hypothetical protein
MVLFVETGARRENDLRRLRNVRDAKMNLRARSREDLD